LSQYLQPSSLLARPYGERYIRRKPNPADRRSVLITLIPSRMRKLASLYEDIERQTRHRLTKLPQEDLEAVIRFFEALQAAREDS
jgi:DNA-binding MarR family transcriptional regulator